MALTGGSAAMAAFLAACGSSDDSGTTTTSSGNGGGAAASETEQFGKGDIGILNYALTLEYLETAFYADVVKSGLFKGAELAVIKKFGEEEAEHVDALTAAVKGLGGKPAPEPKAEFPLKSAKSVVELAGTVENLGAAAYLGQAGTSKARKSWPRPWRSTASRDATRRPSTPCSASRSPRTGRSPSQPTPRPSSSPSNRSSSAEPAAREKRRHTMSNEKFAHPELAAVEVIDDSQDLSRSEVILKGALAAGAVYGTFMVGPYVRKALAMSGGGDVDILNFALTLEFLESTFYEEAKKRVKASGELKQLINLLADDEKQHVDALTATIKSLKGKPVPEPKFNFEYGSTAQFLELAKTFEDTGVSAYNGAGPAIESKEVLGAAGSIVQVEARHAAAIRLQNNEEPAPEAFDPRLTKSRC